MPPWRRSAILFTVCWMCLPMSFLSTAILSTMPEIAASFRTSTTRISTTNALVMVAMALSALVWLPVAAVLGRRGPTCSPTPCSSRARWVARWRPIWRA